MKGRNIKEAELNKMQRMIDAGMADEDISYCMDCSKKTVERIRKGEHVLQIRKKLAEASKAETITHNPERKNEDVFIGAILANQREIIELLDKLASVWRG